MPSVGGVSCLYVRRVVPSSKLRTRKCQVPGISGYGTKVLGYGDSDWTIEVEFWSNEAGVTAWILSIEALQGSIVTIIDDHGMSYLNNFVERVSQPEKTAAVYGGVHGVMGRLTLSGVRK